MGNSTQSTSGRTLCADQESELLAGPIQGWFFNLHSSLTLSALHCYSCSMRTKHFLASTDPTIQSIVSFKINLMLNMFKYIWNYLTSHPCISVSVLNLHEDERQKPENWIPIGWMPNYDKDLAKRPGQGYESNQARKVRLFHDCFRHLLSNWDNQTKSTHNIVWGDQVRRQTRFFLGGLMGDQQATHYTPNISKYI